MGRLDDLIAQYSATFTGRVKETETSLREVERALSISLPGDLRQMLLEYGYGSRAITNLRTAVGDTLRFRKALGLPNQYLVLDDRGDAGTVLLDTQSTDTAVLWIDSHAVEKLWSGGLNASERDAFPTFTSWLEFCLKEDSEFRAT